MLELGIQSCQYGTGNAEVRCVCPLCTQELQGVLGPRGSGSDTKASTAASVSRHYSMAAGAWRLVPILQQLMQQHGNSPSMQQLLVKLRASWEAAEPGREFAARLWQEPEYSSMPMVQLIQQFKRAAVEGCNSLYVSVASTPRADPSFKVRPGYREGLRGRTMEW